jgi:hypothetical protein
VTYAVPPTVTSVSPDKGVTGVTGQVITITGTDFTNANAVTVGTEACVSFTVVSSTTITCTLPSFTTSGTKSVLVTTPSGTNSANTLYQAIEKYLTITAPPQTVQVNVQPSKFSSNQSPVTVSTNNPDGYNLSLKASSSDLTNTTTPATTIPTITGYDLTNPASDSLVSNLIGNSSFWAYRVTSQGSFGSTTTQETNVANTAYSWATVPTIDTLIRTGTQTDDLLTPDTPQITDVWFGVSPTISKASGDYTVTITYTVEEL